MVVSRLERGEGPLDLETLERLAFALDVSLVIELGRDRLETVADAGHLAVQELVLGVSRAAGFRRRIELATRPAEPWRSIDVVVASDVRRLAIAAECWNSIGDLGAAIRSSNRKAAELAATAVGRWGEAARAGLVWVVRSTARNRELVARYPEVFSSAFAGASRGWLATLTTGAEPPADPGLVWCDVGATRLYEWRRR
jgi:transcriptional regulator with XRE-family HTH domain